MMTYTDPQFLFIFLPAVLILYNLFPKKHRAKILLLASYIFFAIISKKLIVYIILATGIIYGCGLWLSRLQNKRDEKLKDAEKEQKKAIKEKFTKKQRRVTVLSALILLGILVVLKYSAFICTNLNSLFDTLDSGIKIKVPHFLMPIGISFYTLQAISYVVDVYKGKIKADKNIGRLALFLSFFPQIIEGPICRYEETAERLWEGNRTTYISLTQGGQRILFGLMKKYIIVDRVNPFILEVFNNYGHHNGGMIAAAMVLYTLQLYMDFSGTMDIAIGVGEMFGVKIPENFKQPFFSRTVSEFWTRWHITLGAFFRDYIYYPISLTKRCKNLTSAGRKKLGNYYGPMLASTIALFSVWLCNGIWHGSDWNYIFFGLYHFTIIFIGRMIEPPVKWFNKKLKINSEAFWYKFLQIIRTVILVFIGELFFRANGLKAGLEMFWKMITNFSLKPIIEKTILDFGVDKYDFMIVGVVVIAIFIISLLKEKGINVREAIAKRNIVLRWSLYYILILSIIIFGCYGIGVTPLDPMYANF
ncbi:MAG: MBOAT family protein [Clostridia bacterium]|nr:MBOAT family protein [Clostridia bacterium]